ncbi:protein-(glutamine-N5) methyltransferase, release factor-specific [Parafrankia colletiae]|uniref:Release factor glutamine methyltransferase n=1 Tax=Parafrankia colletiae TaxID=573497 RepID=A0A1S1QBY8_9ACTN|nr:peptide chain release factor N(5)-glutamine methyltransferase [Parafrankia colletiae]MCK9899664.1 peptide chain release factor N(5)-glutamine methyltransferase [Frankia sp. Cpl3]OHV30735.1 protein-(glutamine-N5) methyltransferase, release factor-specific [Parafrankia colletiae]
MKIPPTAVTPEGQVTLAGELAAAAARLAAAGVASPRGDAEQLAAHVLDVSRGRLALVEVISTSAAQELRHLVERRADRVPLQHLTGLAGFRRLDIAVGPGVFIPRPETEWVVEEAIRLLRASGAVRPICVDLCAGSGAIALSLADEVRGAEVHAVELEPAALDWLRRNVGRTGLPVRVHQADVGVIGAGLPPGSPPATRAGAGPVDGVLSVLAELAGRVDLVVSNPPYLPDHERSRVEPEVGRHDPPAALWGGPDGLDGPRAVVTAAAELLRPGGLLVMEHADEHGQAVPSLLASGGPWSGSWFDIVDHPDLAGRDRFVTARWDPPGRGRPGSAGEDV